MGESLTQRRRVEEEALRGVNSCRGGRSARGLRAHVRDGTPRGRDG